MGGIDLDTMIIALINNTGEQYKYSDFSQIEEDDIKEYEEENPFPENDIFSFEELLGYHTNTSDDCLCFTPDVPKEVIEWIKEMINYFWEQDIECGDESESEDEDEDDSNDGTDEPNK